ncbi:MAG: LacI family DNA-binding transcriptional regulator [Oscillospiraceae bacterium]|nr:LacI family DNA-binding transcriptional regulator [Oscillospiraceae bacterium]
MSTMKEIARLAGVSRGTVDRVINNRGSVNTETERNIREIIESLNYSPNVAGKNLAVRKKKLKFGFIIFDVLHENSYFADVISGIECRAAELSEFGVTVEIRESDVNEPDKQVESISELVDLGINGLVITPINHPMIADKIRELTKSGIPVVTSNSDIPDCGRIAYVGSNYYKNGETAAGLMNLITAGVANIGIISGSPQVLCNSERIAGFSDCSKIHYPELNIIEIKINNDNDDESYTATYDMLTKYPEINALYLTAAGVRGACQAVSELGLAGKLKIISYDATNPICQLLDDGIVTVTIAQQPKLQGTLPLDILLNYLSLGTSPENEFNYTEIEIKIKESL